jgi:hypothetical protein
VNDHSRLINSPTHFAILLLVVDVRDVQRSMVICGCQT